jgi:hypothetical protein
VSQSGKGSDFADGSDFWVHGIDGFFARKFGDTWLGPGSRPPATDPFGERIMHFLHF